MEGRLSDVAYDIGQELIDKFEEAQAEAEQVEAVQKQFEQLLRYIEQFLEFRAMAHFDKGFPSNRRFQRWEIARFARDDFSDAEIESGASYDEALEYLYNRRVTSTLSSVVGSQSTTYSKPSWCEQNHCFQFPISTALSIYVSFDSMISFNSCKSISYHSVPIRSLG